MKSTYKLLGVAWDHAPLPDTCPKFVVEKKVENWKIERNLFDLQVYERQIFISELFSAEQKEIVLDIALRVKDCDRIFIQLDYEPIVDTKDVVSFFALRLLQIYEFLRVHLPVDTDLIIIGSERIEMVCRKLLLEKQVCI